MSLPGEDLLKILLSRYARGEMDRAHRDQFYHIIRLRHERGELDPIEYKQMLKILQSYPLSQPSTISHSSTDNEQIKAFDEMEIETNELKTATEWYKEGLKFYQSNEYDSAIFCFYNSTQMDRNYISAWNAMGVAYSKTGDNNSALIAIESALQIDPNNAIAKKNRDAIIRKNGKSVNSSSPSKVRSKTKARNKKSKQISGLGWIRIALACLIVISVLFVMAIMIH